MEVFLFFVAELGYKINNRSPRFYIGTVIRWVDNGEICLAKPEWFKTHKEVVSLSIGTYEWR